MSGYAFHPEAALDLAEIWDFIAQDSIDSADRVIEQISDTVRTLEQFPHQGNQRPDLTSLPLRFKVVGQYLIAYAPLERPLWIVAVMHGRRSPRLMAAILRSRE
jgi:toxin ParE1/3/4